MKAVLSMLSSGSMHVTQTELQPALSSCQLALYCLHMLPAIYNPS